VATLLVILVTIIIALMIYNVVVYKKIQNFKNINQKIASLNVLQDFMNTIGEYSSVDEKIEKINEILIEKYNIKYSTIVMFNGSEYVIKASNVQDKHWEALRNLHDQEIFKDSIATATPKYVTVNDDKERLPYQTMEFGRAKSAMFFPLYIDNVYIGYWIIESGLPNAFDTIDTTILEVVKENIISVYKTVSYQNTIENIEREDLFSQLKSAEHLYGKGKKIIDKYTTSTVCMFKITNLEQINEEYSRKTGNETITQITKYIKDNISEEYVFVRYMGAKFVIVFSGVDIQGVAEFVQDLKQNIENIEIEEIVLDNKTETKKEKIRYVKPRLNFVLTTYYKGTGLESVTKKLEEYLDNADKKENDINNI
jgi:diguanylate cyclase (GGDEF)-like protein